MLTKTQTVARLPLALGGNVRLNAQMRACAAWATLEEHDKILGERKKGNIFCELNKQHMFMH